MENPILRGYTEKKQPLVTTESHWFSAKVVIISLVLGAILAFFVCGCDYAWASEIVTLKASWYSRADLIRDGQDKKTNFVMANGEVFYDNSMVCASWDFPLGTLLRVTNMAGGNTVIVRNCDRTARRFKGKRIDLSKGAFSKIANCKQGLVSCKVEVI